MTFIYRGSSDYLNNAATDIEQIIKNDEALRQSNVQSVVRPAQRPVVDVPPYTENEDVPTAKTASFYEELVAKPEEQPTIPSARTVDNTQTGKPKGTGMAKGIDLVDKLYGPGMSRQNEDNRQ